jgi:hypothetical protein
MGIDHKSMNWDDISGQEKRETDSNSILRKIVRESPTGSRPPTPGFRRRTNEWVGIKLFDAREAKVGWDGMDRENCGL